MFGKLLALGFVDIATIFINERNESRKKLNDSETFYDRVSDVNTGSIPRSLLRNGTNESEFL